MKDTLKTVPSTKSGGQTYVTERKEVMAERKKGVDVSEVLDRPFWLLLAHYSCRLLILPPSQTLAEHEHLFSPQTDHYTCSRIQMELLCVWTVQCVWDLAIGSHVLIRSRNFEHKHPGWWVLHYSLCVHQLETKDETNDIHSFQLKFTYLEV